MRASFQALAFFGLAAVNAAPMPQQSSVNYSQLWAQQLKSMEDVQKGMGKTPGAAQPTASAAAAQTTVIPSTVHATSTVTAGGAASSAPAQASATKSSGSQASSTAAPSTGGSSSSGGDASVKDGNYQCFGASGTKDTFPKQDKWGTFEALWTNNVALIKTSCTNLQSGADPTQEQIGYMHDGILQVAKESGVDERFILAIIMQESHGCVNVGTTNNGVSNPGIMQSHNGQKFDPANAKQSIVQMIKDGTEGTSSGDGLKQLIAKYGDVFSAARAYNSGSIAGTNLNAANGATATYVTDVANRLTGWVMQPATSKQCPGEQ